MIQWYPGHMAKAIREIQENLRYVDIVFVLLDARCPQSSVNPLLKNTINQKRCLYILTKKDKADDAQTAKWLTYFSKNQMALAVDGRDSLTGKIIVKTVNKMMEEKRAKDLAKGIKPHPMKAMITGIPNVGKSTIINVLCGKKVAQVGDKPGVTTSLQWLRINPSFDLLDTPGVLWPKFESHELGCHLAIAGSIKSEVLPLNEVAHELIHVLKEKYPQTLSKVYGLDETMDEDALFETFKKDFAEKTKSEPNAQKAAFQMIQDYKDGVLGKVTLDWCNDETL
jgi:ribosome biogenesis GTPase A